ncbi:MAG: hypothetical protein JNM14_00730 [Ferruginibacter sp.]|nr:hypothetical protein [Ferruginibacter sp.]
MKKTIQLLSVSLFAACSLFMGSCKKDSTDASGNQNLGSGQGEVRFSYSGAQSGSFQSAISFTTVASSGGITQIAATVVSGTTAKVVQIVFPTNIATGTATQASAGADLANNFLMSYAIGSAGWAIGGGTGAGFTVTVTKNTGTEMEGTFSGELGSDSDPSKVTTASGYFHCKL